jgi:hypothetical protein
LSLTIGTSSVIRKSNSSTELHKRLILRRAGGSPAGQFYWVPKIT